jgi:CRP-like cAMP-binding protein
MNLGRDLTIGRWPMADGWPLAVGRKGYDPCLPSEVPAVSKRKQLGLLEAVPLFHGLSTKELGRVARVADEVSMAAGSVIAEEGAPGDAFYLLADGAAVVRRSGKKIATLGSGDFFGEMSLLDDGPRSATVELTRDSRLLVMHRKDFAGIIADMPGVARKLLQCLATRLREADRKMVV